MKSRPLIAQVLAVNLLLVAATALVATIAVDAHSRAGSRGREALVLGLAIAATLLGNWLLLHRRFEPLDRLISSMEKIDLANPQQRRLPPRTQRQRRGAAARRGAPADDRPARGRAARGRASGGSGPGARAARGSRRTFTTRSTRR